MDKVNNNNKKITQTRSKIPGGFHLISLADIFLFTLVDKSITQAFSINENRKKSGASSVM